MGNLTLHADGIPVCSFQSAAKVPIESLKAYFEPKQLGSGDPSPSNVREIVGWNNIYLMHHQKNAFDVNMDIGQQDNTSTPKRAPLYKWILGGWLNEISYYEPSCVTSFRKTNTGIAFTTTDLRYGVYFVMPVMPNTKIRIDYDCSDNVNMRFCWIKHDWQYITMSGTNASTVTVPENAFYAKISFGGKTTGEEIQYSNIRISVGDDALSAVPYEPYCGQTIPVTFPVLGKNKFDPELSKNDGYATSASAYTISNDIIRYDVKTDYNSLAWAQSSLFDIIPNKTYTLSIYYDEEYYQRTNDYTGDIIRVYCKREDETSFLLKTAVVSDRINNICSISFTTPSDAKQIRIQKTLHYPLTKNDYFIWRVQLELGSTATTYEPYNANNTVYGGYVDLVKGELVANYCIETFTTTGKTSLSKNYDTTEDSVYFNISASNPFISVYASGAEVIAPSTGVGLKPKNGLCNWLNIVNADNWRGTTYVNTLCSNYSPTGFSIRIANNLVNVSSEDNEAIKATKINAYLAEHPLVVGYTLVTPQFVGCLTPTLLTAFRGQNHVWSNASNTIEVDYDLHETRAIQQAKKRIAANEPHLEEVSGSLVNFITDMRAPLKECKVTFTPVQEGSGTVSPSNIRPIIGWNGLTVTHGRENNSIVHSIVFPNSIGTLYGGNFDLVTGLLTQTFSMVVMDGITLKASNCRQVSSTSEYTRLRGYYVVDFVDLLNSIPYNTGESICSHFPWITYTARRIATPDSIYFASSTRMVYWASSTYTTLEEFNEYLQEQYNNGTPVTLVYPRGTSTIEYQLTPEQIVALKGENIVSTNTNGNIELKYWIH